METGHYTKYTLLHYIFSGDQTILNHVATKVIKHITNFYSLYINSYKKGDNMKL